MTQPTNSPQPIRLGLIGATGTIAKVHVEALQQYETGFQLVAGSARNVTEQKMNGIPLEPLANIFKRADIDAISIATPPGSHAELAVKALEHGKHVILEKPPTRSLAETQTLITTAKAMNEQRAEQNLPPLSLFFLWHQAYNYVIEAAREELAGQEIVNMIGVNKEYIGDYHDLNGWITQPTIAGGGALMDNGTNKLSQIVRLLPAATSFQIEHATFEKHGFTVEMEGHITFSFGQNTHGELHLDWLHKGPYTNDLTIETRSGDTYRIAVDEELYKNGAPLLRRERETDGEEYARGYHDAADHIHKRQSNADTTIMQFIHDAYTKGHISY